MVEDVVKALGYLTLGTRLKRLGERLQAQTQVLLEQAGFDVPASHFPLLAALDRLGASSIGELTEALGVTQPAVTRMVDALEARALVESVKSDDDRRVRTVGLSRAGRDTVKKARRTAWPTIEAAVADVCTGDARELRSVLAAFEEALEHSSLHTRAQRLGTRGAKK